MASATTIHFKGFFKGNASWGVVPYCSRYALRKGYGVTTEDKAEVNCTRCAKQLGIQPAAKKVSSTRGTCQCCFGGYETRQRKGSKSWNLVLHGYVRPGHGYIVGECRGVGYVPYEVSCEQTKVWRDELRSMLSARVNYLARVEAGEIESFEYMASTDERDYHGKRKQKRVEVKKGEGQKPNPFLPDSFSQIPGYETLQQRAANETRQTIEAMQKDIAFLGEKIGAWKPVPFPVQKEG